MTHDEKLAALRIIVGGSDTDEVLSTYITLAGSKIIERAYPYRDDITEVPSKYDSKHLEIAAYMLNKRGAEGQTMHNENSINRAWENGDIPKSMLSGITPVVGTI